MTWTAMKSLFRTRTLASKAEAGLELMALLMLSMPGENAR
jgi:hypothetical protein